MHHHGNTNAYPPQMSPTFIRTQYHLKWDATKQNRIFLGFCDFTMTEHSNYKLLIFSKMNYKLLIILCIHKLLIITAQQHS